MGIRRRVVVGVGGAPRKGDEADGRREVRKNPANFSSGNRGIKPEYSSGRCSDEEQGHKLL